MSKALAAKARARGPRGPHRRAVHAHPQPPVPRPAAAGGDRLRHLRLHGGLRLPVALGRLDPGPGRLPPARRAPPPPSCTARGSTPSTPPPAPAGVTEFATPDGRHQAAPARSTPSTARWACPAPAPPACSRLVTDTKLRRRTRNPGRRSSASPACTGPGGGVIILPPEGQLLRRSRVDRLPGHRDRQTPPALSTPSPAPPPAPSPPNPGPAGRGTDAPPGPGGIEKGETRERRPHHLQAAQPPHRRP